MSWRPFDWTLWSLTTNSLPVSSFSPLWTSFASPASALPGSLVLLTSNLPWAVLYLTSCLTHSSFHVCGLCFPLELWPVLYEILNSETQISILLMVWDPTSHFSEDWRKGISRVQSPLWKIPSCCSKLCRCHIFSNKRLPDCFNAYKCFTHPDLEPSWPPSAGAFNVEQAGTWKDTSWPARYCFG